MVRERGLEPPRPKALAPKASVSTNSTTRANGCVVRVALVPYNYTKIQQKLPEYCTFYIELMV